MNRQQKRITIVCLILFITTLVFCPWYNAESRARSGFSPFLYSPLHKSYYNGVNHYVQSHNDRIDVTVLWSEWIVIGVFYTSLYFLVKKPSK
jgi:hypothetical protein